MSELPKFEKLALLFTGFVVLFLGGVSYLTIFTSTAPPLTYSNTENSVSVLRELASVESSKTSSSDSLSDFDGKMTSINLKCLSKNKSVRLEGTARLLQIKGQICYKGTVKKFKIFNRTNGAKASIFRLKNGKFLSDYISLAPGENQLFVRLIFEDGRKVLNNLIFSSPQKSTK